MSGQGAAQRRPGSTLPDEQATPGSTTYTDAQNRSGGRAWLLTLPYPSPPLRDNDRPHWAAKARTVKELRRDAWVLARAEKLPKGLGRVRIVLHWRPAIVRRRDPLSAAPTLKPLVDGLVDYGLVVDDDIEHVELRCVVEPVGRPGRVWLTITDISDETLKSPGEQLLHDIFGTQTDTEVEL